MSTQIIKSILSKLGESFLSKVGEHMGDNAHNNVKSIKDLELTLNTLQKNLKPLNAKAYDVEEVIKHAELSGQKKRKREVEEWLSAVKLIETEILELGSEVESAGFIGRLMSGGKAAKLNEEVDKLVEQSRHFGELVVDVCGTRGETLLTTRMVGGGFEQNLERIWMRLGSGEVSSIGVHGMGGAGKTTLAKHVHNRLLKKSHVFWVTVSQEYTVKSLQDKIARSLGAKLLDEDDEDIRAARLNEAVRLNRALSQQKSSVLILDDVWEYIDLVKLGYPVSGDCCRLLITTCSLEVCHQIGCEEVIAVKELHEDDSWKLFKETLTLGKEINLGPEVEKITECVARLCDGLPLGIITMAASMRGATTIHTWRTAFEELKASITRQDEMGEVDKVFKVWKYSFDRLNRNQVSQSNAFNSIQLCFLYCSLYPEDHKIPEKELVERFMSEGLLDKRSSRREQVNLGRSILDKLVKVCLLESCVNVYDESVKMHDLVRGMALKIGEGKYMVRAGDFYSLKDIPMEEEWTQDLEKVSLMRNGIRSIPNGTSPNCPKLSTLLLQGNILLEVIPDSFFSKMQVLCTLDLSMTHIKTLPDCLSDMKCLKALLLGDCVRLEDVPYLGKLKALRKLDLTRTVIKEVPQGVEELLNLKFFSLDGADKLEVIRPGLLLKLVRLQYVRIPCHLHATIIEEIENLKQLEEFRGRIRNEHEFNRFITSRVLNTSYIVRVGSVVHECWSPSYEKMVRMYECNVKEEVQKYEKALGPDIVSLFIRKCEGLSKFLLDDFSPSNYPRSLEELEIEECRGIEWIFTSEQELQISSLEDIWLVGLEDLKGLIYRGEIGASAVFSSLRSLHIEKCNMMRKLGLSVLASQNLENIYIKECREIEEIFEDEGRGEREGGEGRSIALPKLKKLSLSRLPRLKSLCKATIICDSIQSIKIKECPRLINKLPLHLEMDVPPPPSLEYIMVEREWWESLEWDNPNLPHRLQPLLQFCYDDKVD